MTEVEKIYIYFIRLSESYAYGRAQTLAKWRKIVAPVDQRDPQKCVPHT